MFIISQSIYAIQIIQYHSKQSRGTVKWLEEKRLSTMAQCQQTISNFPVEVIHKIFSYLSDEEILFSFGNVNQYFKNIVINYIRVVCIDLLPIEDENGDVFQVVLMRPSHSLYVRIGTSDFGVRSQLAILRTDKGLQ